MIEVASFGRLLAGTGDTVAATFYADGEVADHGEVTVDVARADGTVVATARPAGGAGAAPRTVPLTPAETAELGPLLLTWHAAFAGVATDLRTSAEVVGAHLFTVAEGRRFDKGQLADPAAYPEAAIEEARGRIADAFGHICGVEFIPRYREATLDGGQWGRRDWSGCAGSSSDGLALPDQLVTALRAAGTRASGGDTWTAFTPDELAAVQLDDDGLLWREGAGWPRGRRNIRVGYVCGYPAVPLDIKEAALTLAVNQLVPRDIGDRALSLATEVGTFRLATAGERGAWFGYPKVDSVLQRYIRVAFPAIG